MVNNERNITYFQKYSEENIHPCFESTCPIIEDMVRKYSANVQTFSLCDLGCGDGAVLFALNKNGLLEKADKVIGVDISPIRSERAKRLGIKQFNGVVSDACKVGQLPSHSLDLIICSQVIEHVPNDKLLIDEIYRLLKKGGRAYIGSVIRKKPGIWIYRKNNKWVLDPTHIHEYSSEDEFLSLFNRGAFAIRKFSVSPCRMPFYDIFVRLLVKVRAISPDKANLLIGRQHNFQKLCFPIYGFYIVKVVIEKL